MKKYLLILTTLLISSSCWAQFDMDELASQHPEHAKRINAVSKFLVRMGVSLDKDNMDLRINRYEGNNLYYFRSKNGRIAIVVEPSTSGADIVIYPRDLFYSGIVPVKIVNTILEKQESNEMLTDVLNFDNSITTVAKTTPISQGSRMIREIKLDNNGVEKKVFKGPVLILVTLDPVNQMWVEQNTFDRIGPTEFKSRIADDGAFNDAFFGLRARQDLRNKLVLYSGVKNIYVSDVALINKMMDRLVLELEKNSSTISTEAASLLSSRGMVPFMQEVSENYPEYKELYFFVEQWNEKFTKEGSVSKMTDQKGERELEISVFSKGLLESIELFKATDFK